MRTDCDLPPLNTCLCFQVLEVYPATVFCSGSFRRKCWTHWTSKDFILFTARWSNTCRTSPKRGKPLLFKENLIWEKYIFVTWSLTSLPVYARTRLQIEGPYNEAFLEKLQKCPSENDGSVEYAVAKVRELETSVGALYLHQFHIKTTTATKCFTENETQK